MASEIGSLDHQQAQTDLVRRLAEANNPGEARAAIERHEKFVIDAVQHGPVNRDAHTIPAPKYPLEIRIDDYDGRVGSRFAPDGPVEVWIMGIERHPDPAKNVGSAIVEETADGTVMRPRQTWVMPLQFPNYDVAQRAGGAISALLEGLRGVAAEPIPTVDDGHPHRIRLERFSRHQPRRAVCELCMHVLVDDVDVWLTDPERVRDLPAVRDIKQPVVAVIEAWTNRGRA